MIKFIGTDRLVEVTNEASGQREYIYGLNGSIYNPGTYAVFEII